MRSHPRCGLSVVCCDVMYAVLYVRVSCFVMRGCAVSRRYINVCNCDVFVVLLMCTLIIRSSVLCVLMVEDMSVVMNVMLCLISLMSPSYVFWGCLL